MEMSSTYLIPEVSLFGERKSVLYRLPQSDICIIASTLTTSSCGDDPENGRSQLFAEHIWPGSLVLSDYLVDHSEDLVRDKTVLEFGAGAGLPSIVASRLQARLVVCSDYPDEYILDNIRSLAHRNHCDQLVVEGHRWGTAVDQLLQYLPVTTDRFDLLILAECLWKDTFPLHSALLESMRCCMHQQSIALVSFAHRPCATHSENHDLEFLERAQIELGLRVKLLKATDQYSDAMDADPIIVYLYALSFQ
jgi:predicted nicotinamide N-methyase